MLELLWTELRIEMGEAAEIVTMWSLHLARDAHLWWEETGRVALDDPYVLGLLGLPVVIGLIGRQVSAVLAALLIAGFGASAGASQSLGATENGFHLSFPLAAQVPLLLGALMHRRRSRAGVRALRATEERLREVQTRLDREIRWRCAADETTPAAPVPHAEADLPWPDLRGTVALIK